MRIKYLFAVILISLLGLNACDKREEGPLEKAGKEIDDAVSDSKEEKSLGDQIGEEVEELGDRIEDQN